MTAVKAFHFKKLLIIVRFGHASASEILLIILVDISCIRRFHAVINTPLIIRPRSYQHTPATAPQTFPRDSRRKRRDAPEWRGGENAFRRARNT